MTYDKLLIATGTQIRKSEIPGSDAKHVYYLRTGHDQE
jgi:apoptosis-inducing factor 3